MTDEIDPLQRTWRDATSQEWLTTPTGLQANSALAARRISVLTFNLVTWAGFLAVLAHVLEAGGWSGTDILIFLCAMLGTPWAILGFCNALIGLWLLHGAKQPLQEVAPFLAGATARRPITSKTAVLMTLRNEDPARALRRLAIVKESLDATRPGDAFAYFVLSDTDREDVAAAELAAVNAWRAAQHDDAKIIYRRRAINTGFKAGNLRDFCDNLGRDYEFMIPLDADSIMTGEAICNLVGIMEGQPNLGILQSLVVGTPSSSPFARIFQFGMRLGMRTYTMGQAWWVGDCGPFWGHNAVVRIAPFRDHCVLPVLPGAPPLGGHILSHDQVEAVLMRRAGYEVRVMPIEGGSYEDNPPDALEFIRRDVRWCQGNLQYLKLLGLEGIKPVSRFQLVWAILMFVGVPAWTIMIAVSPLAVLEARAVADYPVQTAQALYVGFLLMYLAPKIAGVADALFTRGEVARFGGGARFCSAVVLEFVFSFLQGAVTSIRTTIFMIGLLFGKSIVWSGQNRDAASVGWSEATRALWAQLVFGALVLTALAMASPEALVWSLPLTAGYVLAIPFTVLTANPALGRLMRQRGIAAIPEDFTPPAEIAALERAKPLP